MKGSVVQVEKHHFSLGTTTYFLCTIASSTTVFLFYFYVFSPLLTLLPWYTFVLFNRKKPYFKHWHIKHHLLTFIYVYVLSLVIAFCILWMFATTRGFISNTVAFILFILLALLAIVHSTYLMIKTAKSVAH